MSSAIIMIALSLLVGFALRRFSWRAIATSSMALAVVAALVLHREGSGGLAGIATIVACLTLNQLAYFISLLTHGSPRGEEINRTCKGC